MKTKLSLLITLSLCLQTNALYSMHQMERKRTAEAHADAGDAKTSTARSYECCNPDALPTGPRGMVNQFVFDPIECAMALLEHREISIEENYRSSAIIPLNSHKIVFACIKRSSGGTLKLMDVGSKEPVITELTHEPCEITSLIKINDRLIAFGLEEDGIFKIWDLQDNRVVATQEDFGLLNSNWIHLSALSESYFIAGFGLNVFLLDISDPNKPKRILLSDTYFREPFYKVSNTEFFFKCDARNDIMIIDLKDISNPSKKVVTLNSPLVGLSMSCSKSIVTHEHASSLITFHDLSTGKDTAQLDDQAFAENNNYRYSCPLSTDHVVISCGNGFKIINIKNLQQPVCIATINKKHMFGGVFKLSDSCFVFPVNNKLHIYGPNKEALTEYYKLTLQQRERLKALITSLNKQKQPLSLEKVQANAIFKSMPAAIQARIIDNFNLQAKVISGDSHADHKDTK